MTAPFVGPPPDRPGCVHAITLQHDTCGRPPTVHITVFTDQDGLVDLPSCRRHAALARATGDFIAEHPYEALCATGICWPNNANRTSLLVDTQPRSSARQTADFTLLVVLLAIAGVALVLLLGGINMVLDGPP